MTVSLAKGARHARETLEASAAHTASGDTGSFQVETYGTADILLDVTVASGTSPTLDVYIEKLLPDGTTWQDIYHFPQATTAYGKKAVSLIGQAPDEFTVQNQAIAASAIVTTLFGAIWRISWVLTGTSPSFTFSITGDFYDRS